MREMLQNEKGCKTIGADRGDAAAATRIVRGPSPSVEKREASPRRCSQKTRAQEARSESGRTPRRVGGVSRALRLVMVPEFVPKEEK